MAAVTRCGWLGAVLSFLMLSCGEPESGGSNSAGGSAGKGGTAGQGGQPDEVTGGQGGGGKQAGGSAGTGDDSAGSGGATDQGAAGSPSERCTFPSTIPVSGADCPAECQGEGAAYEDCDGQGFIQIACADTWFLIHQECGQHLCDNPRAEGMSCESGFVCIEQVGGAQIFECRPHDCGTGPITCECLGAACPGACTQTGMLDFTCNTCSSGTCP